MSDIGEKRLREIAESIESRLRTTHVARDWSEIILVMLRAELSGLLDKGDKVCTEFGHHHNETGKGDYLSLTIAMRDLREELSKWK
jgi:hypothetical protein